MPEEKCSFEVLRAEISRIAKMAALIEHFSHDCTHHNMSAACMEEERMKPAFDRAVDRFIAMLQACVKKG
jgi:Mn-dependent DtxR family transcriptional regulator